MHMTPAFMNEKVIVQKPDGETKKQLLAIFSRNTMIVEDGGIEVDPGDMIIRINQGNVERYSVLSVEHKLLNEKFVTYQLKLDAISDLPEDIDILLSD
jgi:hypothetical protein